jgi:hypothetical protein
MCFGGGGGPLQAGAEQLRQNELAKQRQEELSRIAAAREAEARSQQAEMQRLQQAQTDAQVSQQKTTAELAVQRDAQQAELAGQQRVTQAAAQSLRVLAAQANQDSAPTAQMSRPRAAGKARATSATNDLRIGSSGRGAGVGVNLGG